MYVSYRDLLFDPKGRVCDIPSVEQGTCKYYTHLLFLCFVWYDG